MADGKSVNCEKRIRPCALIALLKAKPPLFIRSCYSASRYCLLTAYCACKCLLLPVMLLIYGQHDQDAV